MELAKEVQNLFENGKKERQAMIEKAINADINMLSITKFIEVVEFKINEILPSNAMWNMFREKIPIYITDNLVRVFGYKGDLYTQKQALLKLVKKYNIPTIRLDNLEYSKFLCRSETTQNKRDQDFNAREYSKFLYRPETIQNKGDQDFNFMEYYPKLNSSTGKGKQFTRLLCLKLLKSYLL